MAYYDMLKAEVIDPGLCTRCGSCVGVCPEGALRIADELGECLPELAGACDDCGGECYLGCPGRYVDFPALNQILHGRQPDSYLLGHHRGLWVAHAVDAKVRREGASGGIATAVVKHLFETGRIEGAQVMGMDPDRPYLPRPLLARSFEEAQAASQSKYVVSPHNTLLADIPAEGGPLAYVGVPCQVHSLRKLQQIGHPVARRFRYVVGIYCGNILHMSSTRDFLAKHGVHRLDEVASLAFRAGEWPGNLRIELRTGRVIEMPKFHANYLIPFHIMKRCLLCADLSNEFADISGGDAWAPVYEQRGKGFSMMLARTAAGEELADEMIRQGKLSVTPVTADEAVAMHSHGLDLKKRGVFLRIGRRLTERRAAPEYGFRLASEVALSRRVMEMVMGLIFRFCWTRLGRGLIQLVPDRLIGVLFKTARTRWKSATKATKRTGLGSVELAADPPGGPASADTAKAGGDPLSPLYD